MVAASQEDNKGGRRELIVGLLLVRSWWWHHLKKAQDIGDFRDRTHHCGLHCGGSVVEALAAMSLTQLP